MTTPIQQITAYYRALGFEPGSEIWLNTYQHGVYSGTYHGSTIDLWKCRANGKDGTATRWQRAAKIDDPVAFLRSLGANGANIQSAPNHPVGGLGKHHASKFTSLFYEIDDRTLDEQRTKLANFRAKTGLQPSAVVFSGSKSLHVYFALSSAVDGDAWSRAMEKLAVVIGGDPAICTRSRLMRLPGVPRVKNGEPKEVALLETSEHRYSLESIEDILDSYLPHGLTRNRWLAYRNKDVTANEARTLEPDALLLHYGKYRRAVAKDVAALFDLDSDNLPPVLPDGTTTADVITAFVAAQFGNRVAEFGGATDVTSSTNPFEGELRESAIDPALAKLNTQYLSGAAARERFARGFAPKKSQQFRAIEGGALFFFGVDPLTDEPLDWVRCKPLHPREGWEKDDSGQWRSTGKIVKYETLPGHKLRVSYFAVTLEVWQTIADRYRVPMPADVVTTDDGAALGFWQWIQENPAIELIVTEGEKKALSLLSAGFAAVSVPGINCGYRCTRDSAGKVIGRRLHPDLLPFANRRIAIAFDRDEKLSTRLKVDGAIATTSNLLVGAGAMPVVIRWDGQRGKGIDDFIAADGDVAIALAKASSPPSLSLHYARKRVANRLGSYKPDVTVDVPCMSAIDPESIPQAGIVAIIGNTGTGKTKLLEKQASELDKVLSAGFRISLQRGLSQRLGLTYIKDCDRGAGYCIDADGRPTHKLSFVWDSAPAIPLHHYQKGSYDLILDEADQGLLHLISGRTCGKDGARPLRVAYAKSMITGARRIILASATLTRHELDIIAKIRGEKPWILQNTYKANSYPITLYSGQSGIEKSTANARAVVISQIRDAIKSGKRVIVPTDQLRTAKAIAALGESLGLLPHEVLRFDSETSGNEWQREFADDPDAFLAKHDIRLLVHSPSLSSGVSIEGDRFDFVFGIFEGQTFSPDDALQALARVRRPIPRIVYASHYGKSSDPIQATRAADYAFYLNKRSEASCQLVTANDPNLAHEWERLVSPGFDDPFAEYHAATQAERNSSMISFGASLQALLENAGCELSIAPLPDESEGIKEAHQLWRALLHSATEAGYISRLEADKIDALRAEELRKKKVLSYSEALQLQRFNLCEWYAIDPEKLTYEDVKFDRNGRRRGALSRLEALLWDGLALSKDTKQAERLISHNAPIQQHDLPARALENELLIELGVRELLAKAIEGCWSKKTDWVCDFAAKVRAAGEKLAGCVGFRVHSKMSDVQILGMFLKHLGFDTYWQRMRIEGQLTRFYSVKPESLENIQAVLCRRAERHTSEGFKPVPHPLSSLILGGVEQPEKVPPAEHRAPVFAGGAIHPAKFTNSLTS